MTTPRNLILAALLIPAAALANHEAPLTGASLDVDSGRMTAEMVLDLKSLNVPSSRSALITPFLINSKGDSLALDPLAVYGRKSRIHNERLRREIPNPWFAASDAPASYTYTREVPFTADLSSAALALRIDTYGCADCLKETRWIDAASWEMPRFNPADAVVYEVPAVTAVKETALSGKAFVEFPVNKTTLLTDFRTNAAELAKITATIDSVKSDPDITLTAISIKGYASPEGSYSNNRRLAEGRTEALRQWVERLYSFPRGFIMTAYEPEDWQGLREAVEADPTLPYRAGLLEIINNESLEPDARDARLRSAYPEAYARLLEEIYPSLRHSDYRVEYTIRSYTSPEEILAVMEQNPFKLSPDEFFAAAQTLDPDSDLFRRVLETAAKVHPDSEAANLNAASVAIKAGNLTDAELYLSRAGNSPEALYSRGLLAMALKDYGRAELLLNQAAAMGYTKANELLPQIPALRKVSK